MKETKSSLQERDRQVYLNGIRKFMVEGIPVYIDGEKTEEDELEQLFSPPEGMFYMADFVMEESPAADRAQKGAANMIREGAGDNSEYLSDEGQKRFTLKEIRFDPAYHS